MRQTLWCVVVFLVAMGLGAERYHRDTVAAQKFYKAAGGVPEALIVQRTTPDTAQVCAEPVDGGVLNCRSAGDFRKWVVQPLPSKAKK